MIIITPKWISRLSLQKQAVLLMAIRGPDGFPKYHKSKPVLWYYRAFVLAAAHTGRMIRPGEHVPSLMTLKDWDTGGWDRALSDFQDVVDELPLHYFTHLMHGAQVLTVEHPDVEVQKKWCSFYAMCCDYLHVPQEKKESYNRRLSDFGRALDEVLD